MYALLLTLHSIVRWLVLATLTGSFGRSLAGWLGRSAFSRTDNALRHWTATVAHVQLLIGLALYGISPLIRYFFHDYGAAVHQREIRFFGMEHSLMMLTAVVLITAGSMLAKRRGEAGQKFKTMALWYGLALLIILLSVPWPFSPMAARPLFRGF